MIVFEVERLLSKKGMTMTDLANELGVEPQTVHYWNQGRSVPRVPMLLTICKMISVTWAELGDYLVIRGIAV